MSNELNYKPNSRRSKVEQKANSTEKEKVQKVQITNTLMVILDIQF